MSLKPQDVLVTLKLCCLGERDWTFSNLGEMLGLSQGETYNATKRAKQAGLIFEKDGTLHVVRARLFRFLQHGVSSSFYPVRGPVGRGMPTAISAPVMADKGLVQADIPVVWPADKGTVRGESLDPIYPTVVAACSQDSKLYDLLALVDVLRVGRARERKIASDLLEKRIMPNGEKEPD